MMTSIARSPNAKFSYWAPSIRIYVIYFVHFKRRYAHKWKLTSPPSPPDPSPHISGMWMCMRECMCAMMSIQFHDNVKFPFEIHAHCFSGHFSIFSTQFLHRPSFAVLFIFKSVFSQSLFIPFLFFPMFDLVFWSFLFRIIYFMWWSTWTVVIWCFTFKLRDGLLSIKQNSLAPKSCRDWNFYIRWESFIGMCIAMT